MPHRPREKREICPLNQPDYSTVTKLITTPDLWGGMAAHGRLNGRNRHGRLCPSIDLIIYRMGGSTCRFRTRYTVCLHARLAQEQSEQRPSELGAQFV